MPPIPRTNPSKSTNNRQKKRNNQRTRTKNPRPRVPFWFPTRPNVRIRNGIENSAIKVPRTDRFTEIYARREEQLY